MDETTPIPKKRFGSNRILNIFFIIAFSFIFLYYTLSGPTWNQSLANREATIIHVSPDETLTSVTKELEAKKVVRQAEALKIFVYLFKGGRNVASGDYLFNVRIPVWRVAWMLARGEHGVDPVRITIKEGATLDDMALVYGTELQAFRRDLFMSDPKSTEGYLFPDTYFFFPLTTSDEIVDQMSADFTKRIAPLKTDISNSGHSLDEIITMASLVQKEAQGESDAPIVAGILWKRIKNHMPLQVDADRSTYASMGLPAEPTRCHQSGAVSPRFALSLLSA